VSGGIAERARFNTQLAATVLARGLRLSVLRRHRLEPALRNPGVDQAPRSAQNSTISREAWSSTQSADGGIVAVLLLGARRGRYSAEGGISAHPPSSIPFLALGAWVLSVGWFGFNVMSAQTIDKISDSSPSTR
jgi:Amt family ammonium transporter